MENYEQKYKEALKIMEGLYNVVKYQSSSDASLTLQTIEKAFPELRESEDERIRKTLIENFSNMAMFSNWGAINKIQVSDIIAWLEKQKTIDVLDKEEREFADNVDSYRKDMDEFYKKGYNAGREAEKQYWLEKQGEQKPSWSEEDEKLYTSALWHIKNSCGNGGHDSGEYEVYNWLKSIKDRVQLQQKQEWNEKDKHILKNIHDFVKENTIDSNRVNCAEECLNWLKSLKPQPNQYDKGYKDGYSAAKYNHWKPSEEQIEAIKFCCANFEEYDALKSLYNDLENL